MSTLANDSILSHSFSYVETNIITYSIFSLQLLTASLAFSLLFLNFDLLESGRCSA